VEIVVVNASPRYAPVLRRLHWLMALLILVVYVAIEQRGLFERGSTARFAMMQSHFWLGLTVFFLVGWRLAFRMRHGTFEHARCRHGKRAFKTGRVQPCLLLIIPVLGLAGTDRWKDPVPFTDIALPAPIAPDKELAHQLKTCTERSAKSSTGDRLACAGRGLPPPRPPRRHLAQNALKRSSS
jgi:cytochrome b561